MKIQEIKKKLELKNFESEIDLKSYIDYFKIITNFLKKQNYPFQSENIFFEKIEKEFLKSKNFEKNENLKISAIFFLYEEFFMNQLDLIKEYDSVIYFSLKNINDIFFNLMKFFLRKNFEKEKNFGEIFLEKKNWKI